MLTCPLGSVDVHLSKPAILHWLDLSLDSDECLLPWWLDLICWPCLSGPHFFPCTNSFFFIHKYMVSEGIVSITDWFSAKLIATCPPFSVDVCGLSHQEVDSFPLPLNLGRRGGEGNRTWKKWLCVTSGPGLKKLSPSWLQPPHNKTQARPPHDDRETPGEGQAQLAPSHSTHPTHSSYGTRHVAIPSVAI